MRSAFITGITGQDGSYLAKLLLSKGYKVYGGYRRSSSVNFWRLKYLNILENNNLNLIEYDLTDLSTNIRLVEKYKFDEIYNLAAQSFVGVSFDQPILTADITAVGPLNILESIRIVNPKIRYYQASTSEMFGKVQSIPQSEKTPFYPRSPYGIAKLYAHWMTINYSEAYDIFACSGILFNHESPLRGQEFVTRKITTFVAKIASGHKGVLELGNLNAKRDWGYAKDYVEGMFLMLQADAPETYVLATNRTETIRDFTTMAFAAANINIEWQGKDSSEIGIDSSTGKELVRVSPKFYRPSEVELLKGDYSKANKQLGWKPETSLEELCDLMVTSDIEGLNKGSLF